MSLDTDHLIQLRQALDAHFNESELRDLCFALGVDYENLPGARARATRRGSS
jgi:hypothetical protein